MGLRLKTEKVIVKDLTNMLTEAKSSIEQQAALIALKVSQEVYNGLVDRVASAESSINLQADAIALRVKSEDFNGNTVASLINQTATTIKLQASKITLEGLITANNNFKVLADGSIEAVNAKLSGSITATRMQAVSSANYYGEIGVTGGYIGFGLFDTRYGAEAFCEILEIEEGKGFTIRDKNNIQRATFGSNAITLRDSAGNIRAELSSAITRLYSPGGNMRFSMTDNYVNITNNGVTLANWG